MDDRGEHAAARAVRGLLARAVAAGFVPGGVAAWRVGEGSEQVVAEGARALRPRIQPAEPTTLYDLASLTKPLATLTLVLLARRRGLIDLRTRLDEILPEAQGRPAGALAVRELLIHSGGLPAWAPLYALAPHPGRLLESILSLPLRTRGRVVYSDIGFILLGMALERLYQEPLGASFARLVAGPLGCTNAIAFAPCPSGVPHAASAASVGVEQMLCVREGVPADAMPALVPGMPDDGNARFLGGAAGHAGLFGTATAVLKVAAQYLAGAGGLLTDEEIRAVTRASSPPGESVRSAGWQLAASRGCSAGPALAPASWGHTGFTGTSVWVDPRRRAVLVLLTNRHHPAHRGIDLHPLRRRFHEVVLRHAGELGEER